MTQVNCVAIQTFQHNYINAKLLETNSPFAQTRLSGWGQKYDPKGKSDPRKDLP